MFGESWRCKVNEFFGTDVMMCGVIAEEIGCGPKIAGCKNSLFSFPAVEEFFIMDEGGDQFTKVLKLNGLFRRMSAADDEGQIIIV